MAKRQKKQEEKKGAPEWMTTFSDMMTLLLCFFVLLFAMSSIDAQKWKAIIEAFTGAPSVFTDPASIIADPNEIETEEMNESSEEQEAEHIEESTLFDQLHDALAEYAESTGGRVEVSRTSHEITVRFADSVLFESGRADLIAGSTELLDSIMNIIASYMQDDVLQKIRIEGHTDNLPINTPQFRNNWWLSTTRSGNVLMYLINQYPDINPGIYSSEGRGEYSPIADNDTEEGRAKNRRVEFVLVRPVGEQPPLIVSDF